MAKSGQLVKASRSLGKELDKLEKAKCLKKAKAKAKVKPRRKAGDGKAKKVSAGDAILKIIKRSRKGVDTATLKKKTGFDGQKVRSNLRVVKHWNRNHALLWYRVK